MKHFTIQTDEQAGELKPFNNTPKFPLKMGHIITPSAGVVERAYWYNYPEADALTFEQCMDIIADKVTIDFIHEMGGGESFGSGTHRGFDIKKGGYDVSIVRTENGFVFMTVFMGNDLDSAIIEIPNPTATKIRLLSQILRGQ